MSLPHDVSPVPEMSAHLPGSETPLGVGDDDGAQDQAINLRRAQVENPEALRLARAL